MQFLSFTIGSRFGMSILTLNFQRLKILFNTSISMFHVVSGVVVLVEFIWHLKMTFSALTVHI